MGKTVEYKIDVITVKLYLDPPVSRTIALAIPENLPVVEAFRETVLRWLKENL